jgi:photosystem II stability/assembly factor-like uncharacterized protein
VYVCYAGFRGVPSKSQPLFVLTSRDGGVTWEQKQVTPATNNPVSPNGFGRSGCTIRTDSHGAVYVFDDQFFVSASGSAPSTIQMIKSTDGGATWATRRTSSRSATAVQPTSLRSGAVSWMASRVPVMT